MQKALFWGKKNFSQKPCSVTYGDTACASKGAPNCIPLAQERTWNKTIVWG